MSEEGHNEGLGLEHAGHLQSHVVADKASERLSYQEDGSSLQVDTVLLNSLENTGIDVSVEYVITLNPTSESFTISETSCIHGYTVIARFCERLKEEGIMFTITSITVVKEYQAFQRYLLFSRVPVSHQLNRLSILQHL